MPRYYFHIARKGELIPDHKGAEFPDMSFAKAEAIASARDVAHQAIDDRHSLNETYVEIHDEAGCFLAAVAVQSVLANPLTPVFEEACDPRQGD